MTFLEFLKNNGYISEDTLNVVEIERKYSNNDIFEIICDIDAIDESTLCKLKAEFFGVNYVNLNSDDVTIKSLIDVEISKKHLCLVFERDCKYGVAIYDHLNIPAIDEIKRELDRKGIERDLEVYISPKSVIKDKIDVFDIKFENNLIINDAIHNAVLCGASDVHIIPHANIFKIQYRIDGMLRDHKIYHKNEFSNVVVSIKVASNLDISENRRPQSGHFSIAHVDFRVSTHPTIYGETLVIRILNKKKEFISINNIGFHENDVDYLIDISNMADGMIIFCGPTGSGKSTSIYSMIDTIDKSTRNIMTLEDPVEYVMKGIRQTEIKDGVISFVDGIKSILRQDPDVIFVGEVRDEQSAGMAIRASMTGHLVFTTIHSNDSIGAIYRFLDFGIKESLIADNIIAIVSQRLVRKSDASNGYSGRTVVYEILKFDNDIRNMISKGSSKEEILNTLITQKNFKTIKDNALTKINSGITTHEEIARIIR